MRLRLIISGLVLIWAALLLPIFQGPDFAQDYAAAHGWWQGLNPNGDTATLLSGCCPELMPLYPRMQTAHPPLATLLALPFAQVSWPVARWLWLLITWGLLVWAWHINQTPPRLCAVTASFWVIALVLGTHESLLFALLASALVLLDRAPAQAGLLIGLAAALKAYPALLVLGLIIADRRQAALWAIGSAVGAMLIAELVLGWGATLGWLRYVPINTARYVDEIGNLSLVRIVRSVLPGASALLSAALLGMLLLVPILPRLRRADFAPLVSIMLLISPLTWRHYIGLTALTTLGTPEQIALLLAGIVAQLVGLNLIPGDNLALVIQLPLLIVLISSWYRGVRLARRRSIA